MRCGWEKLIQTQYQFEHLKWAGLVGRALRARRGQLREPSLPRGQHRYVNLDIARSRRLRAISRLSFTLIEVLIAIAILSTGIVFVMSAFDASLVVLSTSQDTLRMTRLAREKMTEVDRAQGRPAEAGMPEGGIKEETSSGTFSGADSKFHWHLSIRSKGSFGQVRRLTGPNDVPIAGETHSETLNEVVVTIGREGTDRRYSLATYVRTEKGQD